MNIELVSISFAAFLALIGIKVLFESFDDDDDDQSGGTGSAVFEPNYAGLPA